MTTHLQPATPASHHRFHFLDALRGLAAMLVITLHAPTAFTRFIFMHSAFLAVDFFFCLSGFVIAFSYEKRLLGPLSFRDFFVARIIRLYPLAALGTLLGTLGALTTHLLYPAQQSLFALVPQVLFGLLLIPDFLRPSLHFNMFPLDYLMWTLFFELVANFSYAALLRLHISTSRVLLLCAALPFVALALCRVRYGTLNLGVTLFTAPVALLRVCVSFSLGALVFRLYHRYKRPALHSLQASLTAAAIALLFVFIFSGATHIMRSALWELCMIAIVFPLFVFAGAHIALSSRWTTLCAFLGNISYPLYILHGPLLWPLLQHRSEIFALQHTTIATPIMLAYAVLLILIAWVAARFYDAPLRKRLTLAYQHRNASVPA